MRAGFTAAEPVPAAVGDGGGEQARPAKGVGCSRSRQPVVASHSGRVGTVCALRAFTAGVSAVQEGKVEEEEEVVDRCSLDSGGRGRMD